MALFLGAKGEDILGWRSVAHLLNDMHEQLALEMSSMLSGEEVPLLREVKNRLDEEIVFDEQFAADFSESLDAIWKEEDDLLPIREELGRLAQDHFERRRSVIAFHELCMAMEKGLVRRSLEFAAEWMAQHGFGSPPGRYCWFLLGYPGRGEGTIYCDCESILVFDDKDAEKNGYFPVFARKAEELLTQLGLHSRITMAPAHFSWQGSIAEWRTRVSRGMADQRKPEEMAVLMELADLSLMHGDASLASEMLTLVRGMLSFHRGTLAHVARMVSEMPTGLDFFGRLRLEKSGPHRGLFNIEQYALEPLISNIRVLAVKYEVAATNTADRIKDVMERGPLTVDLAERLLWAFHDFASHKIALEIRRSDKDPWLDIEQLSDQDEQALKAGLDAVVNLQRIVYQTFTEND